MEYFQVIHSVGLLHLVLPRHWGLLQFAGCPNVCHRYVIFSANEPFIPIVQPKVLDVRKSVLHLAFPLGYILWIGGFSLQQRLQPFALKNLAVSYVYRHKVNFGQMANRRWLPAGWMKQAGFIIVHVPENTHKKDCNKSTKPREVAHTWKYMAQLSLVLWCCQSRYWSIRSLSIGSCGKQILVLQIFSVLQILVLQ